MQGGQRLWWFHCCFFNSMKILRSSFVWFPVILAMGWFASDAPAASVGPSGYTNAFGTQPAVADWSTLSIGSSAANITTAAGLDAAVTNVLASSVNAQVGIGVNE